MNDVKFEKKIKCPQCGGPSIYSQENAFRPFCSERCRLIDLGAWATEAYKIPTASVSSDTLSVDDADEYPTGDESY